MNDQITSSCLIRLKHAEGELKKKKADLKSTEKGYQKDLNESEKLKKEKDKIAVRLLEIFLKKYLKIFSN